ncbi:MAG: alpha-ketoglutarate-dependent dioxygenase AlkB [Cyanobacteria bacterium K_DeepCast_35m_m2_023]|nr:alpha-ketoglutarate-dependent dioxygenase AlkB [Cyanobacteria bacterium K_DeepCast_35m_m2_023]
MPGLVVRHWPSWWSRADQLQLELLRDIPWRQESIRLFGRQHRLPRLTCWMADPGCSYRYSGLNQVPAPWHPALLDLRQQLECLCGHPLNSVLLNLYRDGNDAMGCHADDEPELDPDASIASLSLGASRALRFKPKPRSAVASACAAVAVELGHGDLLLMDPPTQQHWLHELPRRRRVSHPRINLTFRAIRAPG